VVGSPPQSSGGSFASSENSESVRRAMVMAGRRADNSDTDYADDFTSHPGQRGRSRGRQREEDAPPSIPDEEDELSGGSGPTSRAGGAENHSSASSMNGTAH